MKRLWEKKQYLALGCISVLFIFMGVMSLMSIRTLQGNARVVNYVGIVRGATQKLIKEEIMGWHASRTDPGKPGKAEQGRANQEKAKLGTWYPDDALIKRLDSIIDELLRGQGPNGLVVLRDAAYLENMRQVRQRWEELKEYIIRARQGEEPDTLFALSQEYFTLVDNTVFSAEAYSERQVRRINTILLLVNGAVAVLLIVGVFLYLRSLAVTRRAEALGRIAYIDPLTKINNRARCEQLIERYQTAPEDVVFAVFMFDMNDLKLTNDFFGHKAGDKIIFAFAQALREAAGDKGFVGRFGGDEFLAVFEPGDEAASEAYLRAVREKIDAYNAVRTNTLETIRYAAGYTLANPREKDIEDIIHEADNRMYENKRLLKKSR